MGVPLTLSVRSLARTHATTVDRSRGAIGSGTSAAASLLRCALFHQHLRIIPRIQTLRVQSVPSSRSSGGDVRDRARGPREQVGQASGLDASQLEASIRVKILSLKLMPCSKPVRKKRKTHIVAGSMIRDLAARLQLQEDGTCPKFLRVCADPPADQPSG